MGNCWGNCCCDCVRTCEPHYCEQSKPCVLQLDWMKDIPDDMKLSQMTIPGTHESFALYGICQALCHSWTPEDQLRAGIRYFDCRLRKYNNTLHAFHGCCDMKKTLDQILPVLTDFLKAHPTEFIIFQTQEEYDDYNTTKTSMEMWDEYTKDIKDMIYKYEGKDVTMGQIRGKIFWIEIFATHASKIPNFTVQNEWTVNCRWMNRLKRRKLKDYFNASILMTDTNRIFLHHLSASSDYGMMEPATSAYKLNKYAFRYAGRLGLVMMDYPGEGLINYLIQMNFGKYVDYQMTKVNVLPPMSKDYIYKTMQGTDLKDEQKDEGEKLITDKYRIIPKDERQPINSGDLVYMYHVLTYKTVQWDKNTNYIVVRKKPSTLTIEMEGAQPGEPIKPKCNIIIKNDEFSLKFGIVKSEVDVNDNFKEGNYFGLSTEKDNQTKYLRTQTAYKDSKTKNIPFTYGGGIGIDGLFFMIKANRGQNDTELAVN